VTARRDPVRTLLFVFLALVLLFMLAPIGFVLVYAFSSVSYAIFPPPGYSVRWFVKLLQQEPLFRAALNSLIIAVVATIISLVTGTLAALALVRYRFFGREMLRAIFLAPLIVPRIAFGVAMLIYAIVLRRFGGLDSGFDRIEDRYIADPLPALTGSNARDNIGAVSKHLLGMKRAFVAGDPLD